MLIASNSSLKLIYAATPSAAAELVSADHTELFQQLDALSERMTRSMKRRRDDLSGQLRGLRKRLRHPGYAVTMQRASLKQYSSSLNYAIQRHLLLQNSTARQLIGRLRSRHPSQQLESRKQQRVRLNTELTRQIRQRLREAQAAVTHQQKLLTSLGPAETLNRGYALISDAAGKVVRGPDEVATGDALQIRMKGGRISTEVTAVDAN